MRSLVPVLCMAALAGCGGGSTSGSSGAIINGAANVQPITVQQSPSNAVNMPFTSVTICSPGGGDCATIDHIQVDTGSSGLRIIASKLPVALPQQTDASGTHAIAECAHFADGFAWGPVKIADVKIAGEEAASLPIQVIGDPDFATIPDDCSSAGPAENTVATFGAYGMLGVGEFVQDCGSVCATYDTNGLYFPCPLSGGCLATSTSAAQALDQQVANPVAHFANDNNGVIISLPAISTDGAATVNGSLLFGIATQTNNGLGSAKVFKTAAANGMFTTIYNGQALHYSLFDSGSSAYYFNDVTIPVCSQSDPSAPGFYCPAATQGLSAIIRGADGMSTELGFYVANAHDLVVRHPGYWAFNNVGRPSGAGGSDTFIWGLPAFYGHNVYTAIEGRTTPAGNGPFFAYSY
jgi:hypothetical protein